jgi:hypothetical protein
VLDRWRCPSSEFSHSSFASAISHVSRTVRLGSFRYFLSKGIDEAEDIAPIASAAYADEHIEARFQDETHLMADHRVFLLVRENRLKYLECRCVLHLS